VLASLQLCFDLLGCSLTCLPAYPLDNLTIILFLMAVKSLKPFLMIFSNAVLFFGVHAISYIGTIFLYHIIRQLISVVLSLVVLLLDVLTLVV